MNVSLGRIILYVRDVALLAGFYHNVLGLRPVEEIEGEWAVFEAGGCELALHLAGSQFRAAKPRAPGTASNAKLVFTVDRDLEDLRAELVASGVPMGEIKAYPGLAGPLCDGRDPEGNVFQLSYRAE